MMKKSGAETALLLTPITNNIENYNIIASLKRPVINNWGFEQNVIIKRW